MCLVILRVSLQHIFIKFPYIGIYRPPGGQARFPEGQLGPGGPREAICDHGGPPAVDFDPRTCVKAVSIWNYTEIYGKIGLK